MNRHREMSIGESGEVKLTKTSPSGVILIPTCYLRFVQRTSEPDDVAVWSVMILQQWWKEQVYSDPVNGVGEWRDVKVEKE